MAQRQQLLRHLVHVIIRAVYPSTSNRFSCALLFKHKRLESIVILPDEQIQEEGLFRFGENAFQIPIATGIIAISFNLI